MVSTGAFLNYHSAFVPYVVKRGGRGEQIRRSGTSEIKRCRPSKVIACVCCIHIGDTHTHTQPVWVFKRSFVVLPVQAPQFNAPRVPQYCSNDSPIQTLRIFHVKRREIGEQDSGRKPSACPAPANKPRERHVSHKAALIMPSVVSLMKRLAD